MFLRPCLRPVSLSAGRPVVLSSLLLALVLALSGCAKKEAAPEPLRAVRTIKVESGSVAALQEFSDIRMILYSLMLVLIMIFRPGGIMGSKEVTDTVLGKIFTRKGAKR